MELVHRRARLERKGRLQPVAGRLDGCGIEGQPEERVLERFP